MTTYIPEKPPKKVKLQKASGSLGKGSEETLIEKAIRNVITRYMVGTAQNLIDEYIRIGHKIRTNYEDLAYKYGFKDVEEFIDHCVQFFEEWNDKLPKLLDELEKLRAQNLLLRTLVSPTIKNILKANLYEKLMIYSLAFNVRKEVIEFWKKELDALFEGWRVYDEQAIEILSSAFRDVRGESSEGNGADNVQAPSSPERKS